MSYRTATCRTLAATGFASVLMFTSTGEASPSYAPRLQTALQLDNEPGCTICHDSDDGGDDTVNRPFGKSLMDYGAQGNSDMGSLDAAILAMYEDRVDSDGDGAFDIAELQRGDDPNVASQAPPDPLEPPPKGGEGGAAEPGATSSAGSLTASSGGGTEGGVRGPAQKQLPPEMETGCSVSDGSHHTSRIPAMLWLCLLACLRLANRYPAPRRVLAQPVHGCLTHRITMNQPYRWDQH